MLLGNLAPIMVIGMARLLADEGAEVIGQERHPAKIVSAAAETRPDIVVLDLTTDGARELGARVQQVSPESKVILCDSGEGALEVLDPGAADARRVAVDASEGLRMEMATATSRKTPR